MTSTTRASLHRPTGRNLARLARVLAGGGLVAVPSETVYGLAADALNATACRAIFKAKGRPANDPLIVHVASLEQAAEVAVLNDSARAVAKRFWPGPLTLVLPRQACVPRIVTSGLDSVAVRMPAHPLFLELIRRSGRPLAAPSANASGGLSPTRADHVLRSLGGRIPLIVDDGPCSAGVESTIVARRQNEEMRRMTELGIRQNDEVKKISGWAAILFAPTLVGTVYGMNFDHMPELHWAFGYPMAIGLMVVMGVGLYAVFKRKGWL